jgi:RNA polymerase sigma-70 factor (ECF subfamily)
MEPSEETLIQQAVSGDESALTTLLERAGMQLHAELEARIGTPYRGVVDAADIVQITCLEAFLRIRSFVPAGPGSFLNWLRRISQNNLRDAIKELERDKRPSPRRNVSAAGGDESYIHLIERVAGTTTTVSRAAGRNELTQIVDETLRKLPADYERVLRLYELEGRSAPEVASEMGRSHGAVRMLLARARDCLAEALGSAARYI